MLKDNKIYHIYYTHYPYPFRFGSYHAILRSLTIHGLVERLYKTSKLNNETYERLLRTRQLIRILIYYGEQSPEAAHAIDVINKAHESVIANNEDFLYVLSTFFLEPLRWNENYDVKQIAEDDLQEIIRFWCLIGTRMSINDMPINLNQWKVFQQTYEANYMGYSDYGHQLAIQSLNVLCKQAVPTGFKFIAKQLLLGTADDKIRECLKLPSPVLPPKLILNVINKFKPSFEPKRDIVTT